MITGRTGIAGRVAPDSRVANLSHRALMTVWAPRLGAPTGARRASDRPRAVDDVARPLQPGERDWIERIERRREDVDGSAREIAPMCPFWSVPRIWGRLQLRLVAELAPRSALELGTAFGISGSYQAAALELAGAGRLLTLDREPQLIPIATETFAELGSSAGSSSASGRSGRRSRASRVEAEPIDYSYIDAEHTTEATIENFEVMLPHLAPGAVVIVDDIHLNEGMEAGVGRDQDESASGSSRPAALRDRRRAGANERLATGGAAAGGWLMAHGERAALEGLLAQIRPGVAIDIGTGDGGSVGRIAAYSDFVHSIDSVERVTELPDNVEFHLGASAAVLPGLLDRLADQGRNVDFVLVDGDHSAAGVRSDLEALLASPALARTVIMLHDTLNEEVRRGILAADCERHPAVRHVDLDLVTGFMVADGPFKGQLWGGLGLVVVDAEGDVVLAEQDLYDAPAMIRRASRRLRLAPLRALATRIRSR